MTLRCPFCFEAIPRGQAAFRCTGADPSRCPPVADEALGAFRRRPAEMLPPVTVVSRRLSLRTSTTVDCFQCGKPTTKAVCPRCHNTLPTHFMRTGGRSLAVIGAKESGKSHYVGVLINQLMHSVLGKYGASINAADEYTKSRYARDFRQILYESNQVLPATQSAAADGGLHLPMIFRLQVGTEKQKSALLVFFDTAGEDFERLETLEAEASYVANTDATMLVLDPLQIPSVRDQLGDQVVLPSVTTDPLDILSRTTDLIRERTGLPPNKRIDRPLALSFSKIDAIRGLLKGSPVLRSASHGVTFDAGAAEDISISMHAHVGEWIGSSLDQYVQANWSNVHYFGFSALGRPPVGGQLVGGVAPLRVEDPILWLLSQWKLIQES